MPTELAFKTTSAAAIEWWHRTQVPLLENQEKRSAFMAEMAAEYGPGSDGKTRFLWTYSGWDGALVVTGIEHLNHERTAPPEGWRYDKKVGHLVPALRSDKGKEMARRLKAIQGVPWRNDSESIGIPRHVEGQMDERTGGIRRHDAGVIFDEENGVLYQTWGTSAIYDFLVEAHRRTEVEWIEVSRSEWRETYQRLKESGAQQ